MPSADTLWADSVDVRYILMTERVLVSLEDAVRIFAEDPGQSDLSTADMIDRVDVVYRCGGRYVSTLDDLFSIRLEK